MSLALANIGYGALASLATLHLAARGVGHPGFVLTAVAGAVVVTRLVVAAALDRVGPWRVLAAGCIAQGLGLSAVAAASELPPALIGGMLLGAGYAAVFPALALMVVERAPVEQRGAALGGFTAYLDLGLAVGGPLAGLLATLAGRPGALLIAAVLTALALFVAPKPVGWSTWISACPPRAIGFSLPTTDGRTLGSRGGWTAWSCDACSPRRTRELAGARDRDRSAPGLVLGLG